MLIELKVIGIQIHPETNTPVVWLKEVEGDTVLPIWIGVLEATAIATELEKIEFPRPMTHDLLRNVIKHLGARIEKIEIHDLQSNTFYAKLYLETRGTERLEIDARPSDAIALALRVQAPIVVDDRVINQLGAEGGEAMNQGSDEEKKWKELLESLSPSDFGKYKM